MVILLHIRTVPNFYYVCNCPVVWLFARIDFVNIGLPLSPKCAGVYPVGRFLGEMTLPGRPKESLLYLFFIAIILKLNRSWNYLFFSGFCSG